MISFSDLVSQAGSSGNFYEDWPMSKFSFKVNIGGFSGQLSFETMDGLGASVAKMEYRDSNSQQFYKQHRPTLTTYDPVTLKKGLFQGESGLYDWFTNVSGGALFGDSREVTITLTELQGGKHIDMFIWTLEKAYVTKFTPPSLDGGDDSGAAVEELELSYQTFSAISNPLSFGGNTFVPPPRVDLSRTIGPKDEFEYEKIDLSREAIMEDNSTEKVDLTREKIDNSEADAAINAAREEARLAREEERKAEQEANEEAKAEREAAAEEKREEQEEAFNEAKEEQKEKAEETKKEADDLNEEEGRDPDIFS